LALRDYENGILSYEDRLVRKLEKLNKLV